MKMCANITLIPDSKASGIQALERKPWYYTYQKSVKKGQEDGIYFCDKVLALYVQGTVFNFNSCLPTPKKKERKKIEKKGKDSFLAITR